MKLGEARVGHHCQQQQQQQQQQQRGLRQRERGVEPGRVWREKLWRLCRPRPLTYHKRMAFPLGPCPPTPSPDLARHPCTTPPPIAAMLFSSSGG
ncbi:hypothetical protein E2C01_076955 [Portunus trituberculatus]|uniref:Uncharacterized protein n=1 Tax=Portunus trituberculatus TaxID=210409 RepID=A0A5B7IKZ8_PORTR|nr:hypothetical protein [Portunus trituberculatus]